MSQTTTTVSAPSLLSGFDGILPPAMLAQEGVGVPPPGSGAIPGAATATPGGAPAGGATGAPAGGGADLFPFLMLGFVVILLMLTVMGPRKEKKRRAGMMASLRKHDRVQTIGGVIGSIVEIKSDEIVLKVDESSNTRITFSKSAVQQVLESRERGRTGDAELEPELAKV